MNDFYVLSQVVVFKCTWPKPANGAGFGQLMTQYHHNVFACAVVSGLRK